MSNIAIFEKTKSIIQAQAKKFIELARSHKAVNFEQEASFALQALQANEFLAKTAGNNPDSLINAIHNVASIGLSLNPALKHAYLVPRNGKVCLDISYKGLAHLAIESGSLKYVQAELVYSKDKFLLRGRGQEPVHERNPFDTDRGTVVGAYCIAETTKGDFLVEPMTAKEMLAIRDRTESYKAVVAGKAKSCPWTTDEGEMFKKTVIRRASKSWPMTNTNNDLRVSEAMRVQDDAEMIDVTPSVEAAPAFDTEKALEEIRGILTKLNRDEPTYVGYLTRINGREIKELTDLSQVEIQAAIVQLKDLAAKEEAKNATASN